MVLFKAVSKLDKVFLVSIIFKAIDGLLELIGGVLILFIRPESITRLATTLTQHELNTDPHDFFANHILHSAQDFASGGRIFASVYLLVHGITKIILVVEILREHLWAYKGMVVMLSAFIVYQVYRMLYKPSFSLAFLTIFDVLIIYLTLREETRQKRFFTHKPGKDED